MSWLRRYWKFKKEKTVADGGEVRNEDATDEDTSLTVRVMGMEMRMVDAGTSGSWLNVVHRSEGRVGLAELISGPVIIESEGNDDFNNVNDITVESSKNRSTTTTVKPTGPTLKSELQKQPQVGGERVMRGFG